MSKLIGKLARKKIGVIGDLILDKYVWGSVSRISPEAPIQILNIKKEDYRAGGAANVAANLASLGATVYASGTVGKDENGKILKTVLKKKGVDISGIIEDPHKPTIIKTRMIAQNQQVLRIDSESTELVNSRTASSLIEKVSSKKFDLLIFQDYQKGTLTDKLCKDLIKKIQCSVFVGLKTNSIRKYTGATCVSLNKHELSTLTSTNSVAAGSKKLVKDLKLQFIIVTLGEHGILVATKNGISIQHSSQAREVYDVTGAGDTVLAAFALGYSSGLSLSECARLANIAAGIVVGKLGTSTLTKDELYNFNKSKKVVSLDNLKKIINKKKSQGLSVVFTNGVFDILHDGHTSLLNFAKQQGDVLVVAVNSDQSVRKIKGEKRPILSQEKRLAILSAIEYTDYLLTFDEETPEKLVKELKPDIIVKGEDYKEKQVVGSDRVKTVLAPYVHGTSTTDIIKKILSNYEDRN